MEVFFNELSFERRTELEYDDITELGRIYRFLGEYKIKKCRIDNVSYWSLWELIIKMPNCADAKNFYFAFFQRPYESPDVIERENDYYEHQYSFDGQECYGLALCYIMDSISLSLRGRKWNNPILSIKVDDSSESVRNISYSDHIRYHQQWLDERKEVVLVERSENAVIKSENFRDDHGKDILIEFAKRLQKNKYVTGIVNSLPFQPYRRKFISAIRENGIIEIVLPWTDQGLGLVVKTTGRSLRETEKIAAILEHEYGRI